MARNAYKPRHTRLLRAAPMRPVIAVTNANRPMPPNAKINLRGQQRGVSVVGWEASAAHNMKAHKAFKVHTASDPASS